MKYLILLVVLVTFVLPSYPVTGLEIFDKYQAYANNYDSKLIELYSPNVNIIREVIKPNGEIVRVNIPAKRFFHELKIGQKTAKLKKYKNIYKDITVEEVPNGIKISALRQPATENYWLKMYQIIEPTSSKITEEMMQTKVQAFLKRK